MAFNYDFLIDKKRILIIIVICVLLFFLLKRQGIQQKIYSVDSPKPAFVFETAKVIELKKGKDIWRFNVTKAVINQNKNDVTLFGLDGHFVENEENILIIKTPKANLNLKNSNLFLYGAKISTSKGPIKTLTADKITWISKNETLSGTGNIELKQQNMVLKSGSFLADNKLNKIKIWGEPQIIIDQ